MTCKECLHYDVCKTVGHIDESVRFFKDSQKDCVCFTKSIDTEGIESCIQHLEMLKAEIEWDLPLGYQLDLDLAIKTLKSLFGIKQCNPTFFSDDDSIERVFNKFKYYDE